MRTSVLDLILCDSSTNLLRLPLFGKLTHRIHTGSIYRSGLGVQRLREFPECMFYGCIHDSKQSELGETLLAFAKPVKGYSVRHKEPCDCMYVSVFNNLASSLSRLRSERGQELTASAVFVSSSPYMYPSPLLRPPLTLPPQCPESILPVLINRNLVTKGFPPTSCLLNYPQAIRGGSSASIQLNTRNLRRARDFYAPRWTSLCKPF